MEEDDSPGTTMESPQATPQIPYQNVFGVIFMEIPVFRNMSNARNTAKLPIIDGTDAVDLPCHVVKKTATAGIHARDHAANADLLGIEAVGLILRIPLLAECFKVFVKLLIKQSVILLCKAEKLCLVAVFTYKAVYGNFLFGIENIIFKESTALKTIEIT